MSLLSIAAAFGLYGWVAMSLPSAMMGITIMAFMFGFLVGVDRVHKAATGESLTDERFTEVLEKIL